MGTHSKDTDTDSGAGRSAAHTLPWFLQLVVVSVVLGACLSPFVVLITYSSLGKLPADLFLAFVVCSAVTGALFSILSMSPRFRRATLSEKYFQIRRFFSWLS